MLSHHDQRARWGAAYALGLITLDDALDLRAMPVLLEALASNDGDVRWAAAELIVRLGRKNPDTVSKRLIELAGHGNLNARKMALYCLRDVGGPHDALLAVAESCCGDHHTLLKMAALSLLTRIHDGGDRAAALAIRLLQGDPDGGVRRCAAVALGHLGNRSPHVTEALTRAAKAEGDIYMKRAARGRAHSPRSEIMIDRLEEPAVREFLESARIGHLATVSGQGEPHNVPLCFWFDGLKFYFVVDEKPKRKTGVANQTDEEYRREPARCAGDRSLR